MQTDEASHDTGRHGTAVTRVRVGTGAMGGTVADPAPEVSWQVDAPPSWRCARVQLRVTRDGASEDRTVDADDAHVVGWPFAALRPREAATLMLRVADPSGTWTPWSAELDLLAGFLADGEWCGELLSAEPVPGRPAWFRTEFDVDGEVRRALLFATAHGVYQAALNGQDVDDEVLKPGWTSYHHRLLHQVTDVTDLLRAGANAVGLRAASGWYAESAAWAPRSPFYGDGPAVAAQLVVELADGRTQVVRTDGTWRACLEGPVRAAGIYDGETHDARRALGAWTEPRYDDSGWHPAHASALGVVPEAPVAAGVRRHETVRVREVLRTPGGRTVLDFGQNLVGRLRLTVDGPRGTRITLRHAEVLEHGELGTRPLRRAAATDHLVLAGDGPLTWEPEFTFHGFRYAEVDGWPGELDPADVEAVVLHSELERTGWFECSDPMLERLHENVVWSMRGNFLSLPTDCPQRDERMGWTGDIQVFAPTAAFLFDVDGFLASWLRDLAVEQEASDGVVPHVVPDVLDSGRAPRAAWGDAATVVPWTLYERFGDVATLRTQYPSMRAWAEVLLDVGDDDLLWEGHPQYGDWLDPQAPPDDPGAGRTSADLVASAHVVRSLDLVARAADVVGEQDDAARYAGLAERARGSFVAAYATPAGRLVSDSPTAYAMVIAYDIVAGERRRVAGERLAALVRSAGYRIATGFVGTPIVCDALTATGHLDVAERLLLQTENPSWLYPLTMGATTVWERWDSLLPDGSINPGGMTSFNHYALGAVADWLHRVVAGLAPAAPGYRVLRIEPRPLERLSHAGATLRTRRGTAAVHWERLDGARVRVRARVPACTTAEVLLPGWDAERTVGPGEHEWVVDAPPAVRPALGADATPAQVVGDEAAYQAVLDVLAGHDDAHVRALRARTRWLDRMPLADEYHRHPDIARDLRGALERTDHTRAAAARREGAA